MNRLTFIFILATTGCGFIFGSKDRLILRSNKRYVVADGADEIKFEIVNQVGKIQNLDDFQIYTNFKGEEMFLHNSGPFTTDRPGIHYFKLYGSGDHIFSTEVQAIIDIKKEISLFRNIGDIFIPSIDDPLGHRIEDLSFELEGRAIDTLDLGTSEEKIVLNIILHNRKVGDYTINLVDFPDGKSGLSILDFSHTGDLLNQQLFSFYITNGENILEIEKKSTLGSLSEGEYRFGVKYFRRQKKIKEEIGLRVLEETTSTILNLSEVVFNIEDVLVIRGNDQLDPNYIPLNMGTNMLDIFVKGDLREKVLIKRVGVPISKFNGSESELFDSSEDIDLILKDSEGNGIDDINWELKDKKSWTNFKVSEMNRLGKYKFRALFNGEVVGRTNLFKVGFFNTYAVGEMISGKGYPLFKGGELKQIAFMCDGESMLEKDELISYKDVNGYNILSLKSDDKSYGLSAKLSYEGDDFLLGHWQLNFIDKFIEEHNDPKDFPGLKNFGNTCYVNALLKSLANLDSMKYVWSNISPKREGNREFFHRFKGLINAIRLGKDSPLQITSVHNRFLGEFMKSLEKIIRASGHKEFRFNRQNDPVDIFECLFSSDLIGEAASSLNLIRLDLVTIKELGRLDEAINSIDSNIVEGEEAEALNGGDLTRILAIHFSFQVLNVLGDDFRIDHFMKQKVKFRNRNYSLKSVIDHLGGKNFIFKTSSGHYTANLMGDDWTLHNDRNIMKTSNYISNSSQLFFYELDMES